MQNHALHFTLIGSGVLATAIAVAPFILPGLGVGMEWGNSTLEQTIAFDNCSTGPATGLAGWASNIVSYIPFAGETLAKGGILNAVVAGGVLWGGNKVSDWIKEDEPQAGWISWSGLTKILTIATTALIALPAILPAISMGIDYLSILAGNSFHGEYTYYDGYTKPFVNALGKLGESGAMSSGVLGASGASSLLVSHLLACGVGIAGTSATIAAGAAQHAASPATSVATREALRQPMQQTSYVMHV